MNRPFFQDEVLSDIDGDFEPQYNLENVTGSQRTKIKLANTIERQGTPITSSMMNNMFYFYNLLAMGGVRYRTIGLGTDTITEEIRDITSDILIARNISRKTSQTSWIITETVYLETGVTQERTVSYNQVGTQWEAIIQ